MPWLEKHAMIPTSRSTTVRSFENSKPFNARQSVYRGAIVIDGGEGRFITATLWHTVEEMAVARKAVGPVIQRLLDRLMTAPSDC